MKALHAALLALAAFPVAAQTYYVTEKLEVGVYAQPSLDGDRIATVHSADAVELINREGEAAMVRLNDGSEGWISAAYLEVNPPLAAELETLTAENERLRAAERAEKGAGADVKNLRSRNSELENELARARREVAALQARTTASATQPEDEIPVEPARPADNSRAYLALWIAVAVAAALALGFWSGYRTLEQRVRRKYGGLKVY